MPEQYAAEGSRLEHSLSESMLEPYLRKADKERVTNAVKQSNQTLRSEIRSITGLSLSDSVSGITNQIPVRIIDGLPSALTQTTDQLSEWHWFLLFNRLLLSSARNGLDVLITQQELIQRYSPSSIQESASVVRSRDLIDEILKNEVEQKIIDAAKGINTDILGCYWIGKPEVNIFWMPIAIFSRVLGQDIADLTRVVLCHELVHAYTHCGRDIDGVSWHTSEFAQCDIMIVEGLAQYYTDLIIGKLDAKIGGVRSAFQALKSAQSAAYTDYSNWKIGNNSVSPEVVRLAMLETRNNSDLVGNYELFKAGLEGAHNHIKS